MLKFERERCKVDLEHLKGEREEQSEEWEKIQELYLAKYKLMLDIVKAATTKKKYTGIFYFQSYFTII